MQNLTKLQKYNINRVSKQGGYCLVPNKVVEAGIKCGYPLLATYNFIIRASIGWNYEEMYLTAGIISHGYNNGKIKIPGTGLPERMIQRQLKKIEQTGLIRRKKGGKDSIWQVNLYGDWPYNKGTNEEPELKPPKEKPVETKEEKPIRIKEEEPATPEEAYLESRREMLRGIHTKYCKLINEIPSGEAQRQLNGDLSPESVEKNIQFFQERIKLKESEAQ
ncbi:MAG: hypothetical protein U9Q21_00840, partial [Candidatus Auribacterota bacterium]|nr:hypothetical protein [Candidatus Auribacterota bacterium]